MDYDAIIVGAGPAGLSAAAALAGAGKRVLAIDAESFGGPVINIEWINGYPASGERTAGAALASALVSDAERTGVEMKLAQVCEIEPYSGCLSVACTDGAAYTAPAVIVGAGLRSKPLGVPGEGRLAGKGMIDCALCDAGLYRDRVVVVCGAGRAGLIEALYLARFAAKVYLVEAQAVPNAKQSLQQAARAEPKLELLCNARPVEILGDDGVTGIVIEDTASGARRTLEAYGVLVHVGYEPAAGYLEGVVALDETGRIAVNERFETDVPGIFAAGDARSGSPRSVAAAIADGRAAAAAALERLGA
jgi:thioredoxin reductase (NADPH)